MPTPNGNDGARVLDAPVIEEVRAALRGDLVCDDEPGYEAARSVWNGLIDRRPAFIAYCAGVSDVVYAVNFARANDLVVAVRGGGHSWPGHSVCDGGIVIDLSRMKGLRVDPTGRTARAEPGLTWGEFDRECQAFGLATTGGMVSLTGIAGLTVGGGSQGWLVRKHGATCDNLVSVDVVTADGRFLTANASENPKLFWAVRGGGGNFGIVTSFEFALHPVGPEVLAGPVFYPQAKAKEVLDFYRAFVTSVPDELTTMLAFMTAPEAPFLPESIHGAPMVAIVACYSGPLDQGENVVRPLREFGPPAADLLGPMPYTVLQTMFDDVSPPGQLHYSKTHHFDDLSDGAIDTIAGIAAGVPSALTVVHLNHYEGAFGRVGQEETPLSYRDAPFAFTFSTTWTDPSESEAQIRWARESWEAIRPFSNGRAYVNFMEDEGEDPVRAAYGPNYKRLVALKQEYDPSNFFRLNQNIRP